jgi:UPF0716 protein FxsA
MNPIAILLLLFLIVPLIEIYLLIEIGAVIGALPTVFLVVFTAVLGAWLLRLQGFSTIARIRGTLQSGGIPAVEMLEGAILLVSGALLLTPGFFTDTIGFLCLIPGLRRHLIMHLLRKFFAPFDPFSQSRGSYSDYEDSVRKDYERKKQQHNNTGPTRGSGGESSQSGRAGKSRRHRPTTIEGEYERDDD